MAKRTQKLYILDILESANKIIKYTDDLSYEEFIKDQKTIDAVERNFEIIGEASRNISEKIKLKYLDVDWKNMIGMRNILAHNYFGTELEVMWDTIQEDIPKIIILIKNVLKNFK